MFYRTLLKFWLLPPVVNVLLVLAGILLLRRYRKAGISCCVLGLGSLLLLAMPQVSNHLLQSIEVADALSASEVQRLAVQHSGQAKLQQERQQERQATSEADPGALASALTAQTGRRAIVMLGAGHIEFAGEYGDAYPDKDAVSRLDYAAYLHLNTGLPIMLTGGTPSYSKHAHADVLARHLQRHFNLTPAWRETSSRTTWENASNAAAILLPQDINTVVLVTQSLHMRRGIQLFEAAGFSVIPAPTDLSFDGSPAAQAWRWIPSSRWLHQSSMVMHEMLGYLWYRLRAPY